MFSDFEKETENKLEDLSEKQSQIDDLARQLQVRTPEPQFGAEKNVKFLSDFQSEAISEPQSYNQHTIEREIHKG